MKSGEGGCRLLQLQGTKPSHKKLRSRRAGAGTRREHFLGTLVVLRKDRVLLTNLTAVAAPQDQVIRLLCSRRRHLLPNVAQAVCGCGRLNRTIRDITIRRR